MLRQSAWYFTTRVDYVTLLLALPSEWVEFDGLIGVSRLADRSLESINGRLWTFRG